MKLASKVFLVAMMTWMGSQFALAQRQEITIDDSYSKEQARQQHQQWNETQSLRHKINKRSEKEFDKLDRAIDVRDACQKSSNINAYWEPNTERCLDRRSGQQILIP